MTRLTKVEFDFENGQARFHYRCSDNRNIYSEIPIKRPDLESMENIMWEITKAMNKEELFGRQITVPVE